MQKIRVLFVCMGNICRSPTAESVFRAQVEKAGLTKRIEIDSAGTHAYHVGEPPDARAQQAGSKRGYRMAHLRGRRVSEKDFAEFDYILAMDMENLSNLHSNCPEQHSYKVGLFMEHAKNFLQREVPDPYYGGPGGFEQVLNMVEDASSGLLDHIRRKHLDDGARETAT